MKILSAASGQIGKLFALAGVLPEGEIARGAIGTFVLRGFNYAFLVLLSLVLARLLGSKGYGAYAFAMTSLEILGPLALLGLDPLLIRQVAVYQAQSKWSLLRGMLRRADQVAVAAAIGLIAVVAVVTALLKSQFDPLIAQALWSVLAALPFLVVVRLRQAAMIGLRRVVLGQVGEAVLQPIVVCFLLVGILVVSGRDTQVPALVFANVVAVAAAFFVSNAFLRTAIPHEARRVRPTYRTREWGRDAVMFWLTVNFLILNSGIAVLLLGVMESAESAGIFAAARVLVTIIATPLIFIGLPLAPAMARSFAAGATESLQAASTKATRMAFLFAAPVAATYFLFGDWLLSLYGPEFVVGYRVLLILALGQLANVGFGFVETLLQMTGHERPVAIVLGFSALVNAGLCVWLIPIWGVEGAAIASAVATVSWKAALTVAVQRILSVRPTVLG